MKTCPKCGSAHISTERRIDGNDICMDCGYRWKTGQIVTNGDRFRAMSNEEMADVFYNNKCPPIDCNYKDGYCCKQCWLDWLNSTAENEAKQ